MANRAHGTERFFVSSAAIGICAGLRSASVRMLQKKSFAFVVRQGCRELAGLGGRSCLGADKVHEKFQVRALRSIARDVDLENSSSDVNEVSLARRKCRADFSQVSLQTFGSL